MMIIKDLSYVEASLLPEDNDGVDLREKGDTIEVANQLHYEVRFVDKDGVLREYSDTYEKVVEYLRGAGYQVVIPELAPEPMRPRDKENSYYVFEVRTNLIPSGDGGLAIGPGDPATTTVAVFRDYNTAEAFRKCLDDWWIAELRETYCIYSSSEDDEESYNFQIPIESHKARPTVVPVEKKDKRTGFSVCFKDGEVQVDNFEKFKSFVKEVMEKKYGPAASPPPEEQVKEES